MSEPTSLVPSPPQTRAVGGIGASQVAAAIGLSPYQRPIDVWLEMTGRKPGFSGNEATRWGNVLEPVIRAAYVEAHQVSVYVPPTSLWHRELACLKATPDGIVLDERDAWAWVGPQVKNVGLRQAAAWEDGAPDHYAVQAMVEMAVTGLDRCDFAVLIGGQEYREVTVPRDPSAEASILEAVADFWRLVELDIEPEVDGSASFRAHLIGKVRRRGVVVTADADVNDRIEAWRRAAADKARAEHAEDLAKARVLEVMAKANADAIASAHGRVSLGAGKRTTKWQELARALGATEELIAQHTSVGSPSLNRPKQWTQED